MYSVILNIDLASATPVYRQIIDGLRVLLVNRQLAPGDGLPPVRRLALDLVTRAKRRSELVGRRLVLGAVLIVAGGVLIGVSR